MDTDTEMVITKMMVRLFQITMATDTDTATMTTQMAMTTATAMVPITETAAVMVPIMAAATDANDRIFKKLFVPKTGTKERLCAVNRR